MEAVSGVGLRAALLFAMTAGLACLTPALTWHQARHSGYLSLLNVGSSEFGGISQPTEIFEHLEPGAVLLARLQHQLSERSYFSDFFLAGDSDPALGYAHQFVFEQTFRFTLAETHSITLERSVLPLWELTSSLSRVEDGEEVWFGHPGYPSISDTLVLRAGTYQLWHSGFAVFFSPDHASAWMQRSMVPVPEPGVGMLLGLGALAATKRRKRLLGTLFERT